MAYDLGVPVPPVILAERTETTAGEERFTCVSLFVYPREFSWGMVRDNLQAGRPAIVSLIGPHFGASAARGFAFDTWLDQRDHGDHESNILFGYDDCNQLDAGFVFLDYAFSMGMTGSQEAWSAGGHLLVTEAPFPPMMLQKMDIAVLDETVTQIENYPEGKLEAVVARIPEPYFRRDERGLILAGLRDRKRHLRQFLSRHLEPSGGAP